MRGIPTVVVTVSPDATAQVYPPRAMYPIGFTVGHTFGPAFQSELQRKVVWDALQLLVTPLEPGHVIHKEFPEYQLTQGERVA